MELKDTVYSMLSDDYQERFVAEYNQACIRAKKLKILLDKDDRGELGFKLRCTRSLLESQYLAMLSYIRTLEQRAKVEKINLSEV